MVDALDKQRKFNARMGKRVRLAHGGSIKRKNYANAGSVVGGGLSGAATGAAVGSVVPGIGTAVGAIGGGLAGLLGGLFSGSGPQMPNITDPVTGQMITDAQGRVVATQQQLQDFATSLQGVNGVQNQQAVFKQIQDVSQGKGPNPAQAMLNRATGQNVENTSALMAGQRGAGSNVGLIAREAGQAGANIQERATEQGSTLQSQQQLNALNSESGIAGQQVAETQGALTSANTAAENNQGQLLGAQTSYNNAITGGQGNVNTTNQQQLGTMLTGAGQVANSLGTAVTGKNNLDTDTGTPPEKEAEGGLIHKAVPGPHKSHVANFLVMAKGGKVPAMVSPGEVYLNPEAVHRVLEGENPLKIGERITGKAKVKGDSEKNDTVPKTLDEGGVVISRTHTSNPEKAELFVRRAVHMKKRSK